MSTSNPDDNDSAFVRRYAENPTAIPGAEAVRRHQQVAAQLPPDDYRQAAETALARLSPEERVSLGRYLLTEAPAVGGTGFPDINGDGIDDRLQDPRFLAGVAAQTQQQPGLLDRLLGGMGLAPNASGPLGNTSTGSPAAAAGSTPFASVLGGTLGKVALGGIAAAGLARLLGGGRGHGGGGMFGGGFGGGGHHGGGHH